MKSRNLVSLLLLALLAACNSNPPIQQQPAATPETPAGATPSAGTSALPIDIDPLNDPNNLKLQQRSAYFPYKIDIVQSAHKAMLESHSKYLGSRADRHVRVEGNCDERGSNEYNLALGQRRADNVKKLLMTNGASSGQIDAVSYGEDRPRSKERTEKGWAENRRVDLNYETH